MNHERKHFTEGGNVCLEGEYAELNGQPSLYSPDEAIVYNVESNK